MDDNELTMLVKTVVFVILDYHYVTVILQTTVLDAAILYPNISDSRGSGSFNRSFIRNYSSFQFVGLAQDLVLNI